MRETGTGELLARVAAAKGPKTEEAREVLVELHKRVAIPAAAIAFALVGFPLGTRNRRGGRGFGLTISVGLVVLYYVLLNNGELLATAGKVPAGLGVWLPNLVLLALAAGLFRRASRAIKDEGGLVVWPRFLRGLAHAVARAFRYLGAGLARLVGNRNHARDGVNGEAPRLPLTVGVLDRHLLRQCLGFFVLVVIAV